MADKDYITEEKAWKNHDVRFFLDTQKQQGLEQDALDAHKNNLRKIIQLTHSKKYVEEYAKHFSTMWGHDKDHLLMAKVSETMMDKYQDVEMLEGWYLIVASHVGITSFKPVSNLLEHMCDVMSKKEMKTFMDFIVEIRGYGGPYQDEKASYHPRMNGFQAIDEVLGIARQYAKVGEWSQAKKLFLNTAYIHAKYGDEMISEVLHDIADLIAQEKLSKKKRIGVLKMMSDEFVWVKQTYKYGATWIRDFYLNYQNEADHKNIMQLLHEKRIIDLCQSQQYPSSFIESLGRLHKFLDKGRVRSLLRTLKSLNNRTGYYYVFFLSYQRSIQNFDFWTKKFKGWNQDIVYYVCTNGIYTKHREKGIDIINIIDKEPFVRIIDACNKTKSKVLIFRLGKILEDYVNYPALGDLYSEFAHIKNIGALTHRLLYLRYCIDNKTYLEALKEGKKAFETAVKNCFEHKFGYIPKFREDSDILDILRVALDYEELEPDEKANIDYLIQIQREYGGFLNYFKGEHADVLSKMGKHLKCVALYVGGGKLKLETTAIAASQDWKILAKELVKDLLGSRSTGEKPTCYIKGIPPQKIYGKIKGFLDGIENGDERAAEGMLSALDVTIAGAKDNVEGEREVRELEAISDKILLARGAIQYKKVKGVLTASVCRRRIPRDLYDSELLACCIFLPDGGMKREIAPFMADPRTTLIDFEIGGMKIATAMLYAGVALGNEPMLMLDTVEGGASYHALPGKKMHDFVLKAILELAKKCGFKFLGIAKCAHGRPAEFSRYIKDEYNLNEQNVFFNGEFFGKDENILAFSKLDKHHYTDAFGADKLMSGTFKGYVMEI